MSKSIVVIGAGPGGYVAAIRCAQLGAQVTLVEQEALGGTCLNWGCIPTKTLKATAEILDRFHRAQELGVLLDGAFRPDWERITARKEEVVTLLAQGVRKILEGYKIRLMRGTATLADPKKVLVRNEKEDPVSLETEGIILATGSGPSEIPAFPYDGTFILSSNDALALKEIPKSLLIVGGGVIGCEFAFLFRLFGSQVTVVEALPRVLGLPSLDEDCSTIIQREMKKRKIQVLTDKTVEKVAIVDGRVKAFLGPSPFLKEVREKDQKVVEVEAEKVLVCIGRRSRTDLLGLDRLGVETGPGGWIQVNDKMETNLPGLYAVGDVLGPARPMLAHVASAEGIVAAENLMGLRRTMSYEAVPSAVFTFPEVGCVGLTEAQARERGFRVRADRFPFRALGKPQAMGEIVGQVKILSEEGSGRVLGVHIVGPQATDLIAEGTLALRLGATVEDLARTIHAHPTLSEAVMETAHLATGAPIHLPPLLK